MTQERVLATLGEGVCRVGQFVQIVLGAWLEPQTEKLERAK